MKEKGFTLLELLVVILIVGVLAGIALPQYQLAKEKVIMTEGINLAKQIISSSERYYLLHNVYANKMEDLDIEFIGSKTLDERIITNHFIISPFGTEAELVVIQRIPRATRYYLSILKQTPNRINCVSYSKASNVQKKLCGKFSSTGHL